MFFVYARGKRYLNLEGNLILTHNARLIRGNCKKSTPASIAGGLFLQILPDSGFMLRLRATCSALAFIWGQNTALDPETDAQYRASLEPDAGAVSTPKDVKDLHDPEKIERALTRPKLESVASSKEGAC